MNTYIKHPEFEFAAVRASRNDIKSAFLAVEIVPATKTLRDRAARGTIPTFRILADGRLGYL